MKNKLTRLANDECPSAALPRRVRLVWLVLPAALLTLACQSSPPPRPITETGPLTALSSKARHANAERAIRGISEAVIPKPEGGSFKLADFQGKVVVVDLWATWCPPCVRQMPQLAELSKRYRERGLEIIGLSLNDPRADGEEVTQFMKRTGVSYTIGYADRRISDAFLRGTEDETGAPPIPQLFVLARDGRLVEHLIGDDPARGLTQLEKVITEQLPLSESSP
jgi:thiol-disulfide isomerase/thioredoxin